jgi:hypothetical protein
MVVTMEGLIETVLPQTTVPHPEIVVVSAAPDVPAPAIVICSPVIKTEPSPRVIDDAPADAVVVVANPAPKHDPPTLQ